MKFKFRLAIFIIVLLWYLGIWCEFLTMLWHGFAFTLPFLQIIYSHVCHQDPAKVIYFNGMHTFVCGRCLGIYSGILIVTIFFLFSGRLRTGARWILLSSFVPVALDVFFVKVHLYHYSKTIAFLTGFILGSVGIYYFYETVSVKIKESKN